MITNKDIRVENGSLIINGDPYPLDGQSPEAIMEIVEDNSDTTPTENSDAPITSGGVFTALAGKQDTLTFDNIPTASSSNPVTSGGIYDYLNNLSYSSSGLTPNENCTIKAGGYAKIGNLVIVNIRLDVTANGASVSGFPIPAIAENFNGVGGSGYNSTTGETCNFYLYNSNGLLTIPTANLNIGDLLISFAYVA